MPRETVWQTISSRKLLVNNRRFSQWRIKWPETISTSPEQSVAKATRACALGGEKALRYLAPHFLPQGTLRVAPPTLHLTLTHPPLTSGNIHEEMDSQW